MSSSPSTSPSSATPAATVFSGDFPIDALMSLLRQVGVTTPTTDTTIIIIAPPGSMAINVPWYAVFSGVETGVFSDLSYVDSLVLGVKGGASRIKYPTREAAVTAYNDAVRAGNVLRRSRTDQTVTRVETEIL